MPQRLIVTKFYEIGSVADVKNPVRARAKRSSENIAAIKKNAAESPKTFLWHRAQELHRIHSKKVNNDFSLIGLYAENSSQWMNWRLGSKLQAWRKFITSVRGFEFTDIKSRFDVINTNGWQVYKPAALQILLW